VIADQFPPCWPPERSPGRLVMAIADRLPAEDRAGWDRTADMYASYGWLSAIARQDRCVYVIVRDKGSGEMRCALPVYILTDQRDRGSYDLRIMLAGVITEQNREKAFPMVIVGSRSGYYNTLPVSGSADEATAAEAMGLALAGAAQVAASERAQSFILPYLTATAIDRVLKSGSWPIPPVFTAAYATLPIDFPDVTGYLARFPKKRRRNVRNELTWAERLEPGDSLSVEPLSECAGEVAPLIANVQGRHGHGDTATEITGRLNTLAKFWGANAMAFTYRQSGVLAAAATVIRHSGGLYTRAAGLDYERIAKTPAYFTVTFYQPLALALRTGIGKLYWGTSAYRPKILRGAVLEPLWGLYSFRDAGCLRPGDARLAETRNESVLRTQAAPVYDDDFISDLVRCGQAAGPAGRTSGPR
jgi:uncharacterized protein